MHSHRLTTYTSLFLCRGSAKRNEVLQTLMVRLPHRQHATTTILNQLPTNITGEPFLSAFHNNLYSVQQHQLSWRLSFGPYFPESIQHAYKSYRKWMRIALQLAHHIDYHQICRLHHRDPYNFVRDIKPKIFPTKKSRSFYYSSLLYTSHTLSKQETKHWRFLLKHAMKHARRQWDWLKWLMPIKGAELTNLADVLSIHCFNKMVSYDQTVYRKCTHKLKIYPASIKQYSWNRTRWRKKSRDERQTNRRPKRRQNRPEKPASDISSSQRALPSSRSSHYVMTHLHAPMRIFERKRPIPTITRIEAAVETTAQVDPLSASSDAALKSTSQRSLPSSRSSPYVITPAPMRIFERTRPIPTIIRTKTTAQVDPLSASSAAALQSASPVDARTTDHAVNLSDLIAKINSFSYRIRSLQEFAAKPETDSGSDWRLSD